MAISFTQAPTVAPGDRITYDQLTALALAFNDRIRSGIADPDWRIFYYFFGMFRQIRNSDGAFMFPSMAEFFTFWQNLDPSVPWPDAGVGDPEGANEACQMVRWITGGGDVPSEAERAFPIDNEVPVDNSTGWALAKRQRGAYDPETGAMSAPAMEVARSHYGLTYGPFSPHGNSYGGFAPTPDVIAPDCAPVVDAATPIDYQIKFTNLTTDEVVAYPGTCPEIPEHVSFVANMPWGYYVALNNGQIDFYPISQWLQGPYSGGARLSKQANHAYERVMNAFIGEFRGSDAQRLGHWNLDEAFNVQAFLERHYRLAPQYGKQVGDTIYELYPLFTFGPIASDTRSVAEGSQATFQGKETYKFHGGFVCPGFRLTASGLSSGGELVIYDGTTAVQTVAFSEGDDQIVWLTEAVAFTQLSVKCSKGFAFANATGAVQIEFLETLDYRPGIEDLYTVCRLGAANDGQVPDGLGRDYSHSRELWETYDAYGCMTAGFIAAVTSSINGNAFFDKARRMSQWVRCVPRDNLIGYEVTNGRSILYFKRVALGMAGKAPNDLFVGIAPEREAITSGSLIPGRLYKVTAGQIQHGGRPYITGDIFTAESADFDGGGTVYEYDGIRHEAEPGEWSNEWLMRCEFKVYHQTAPDFKPDIYADYFPLVNRCMFASAEIAVDHELLWHVMPYGVKPVYYPEAPTGYNFAHGINNSRYISDKAAFRESCQIYQASPEIDSATVTIEGGIEVVKLVFTGRFQHDSGAPASISRDISTWTDDFYDAAMPRTMENGIRQYIMRAQTGKHCVAMPGDSALGFDVYTLPAHGACFPHFFFTKLIPKPHNQDGFAYGSGSELLHDQFTQMELYLRAMCEGYVDGITTAALVCECEAIEGRVCSTYDYTFENLCHDALGNRWMRTIPNATGSNVQGFGPLPNTTARAEIFNQFSACINKLDKARVMLPFKFETQATTYIDDLEVDAREANGTLAVGCSTTGKLSRYWDGVPKYPTTETDFQDWTESANAYSYVTAYAVNTCSSGKHVIRSERVDVQWRVVLTDDSIRSIIPEAWRDMETTNFGVITHRVDHDEYCKRSVTADASQSECSGETGFWDTGSGYLKFEGVVTRNDLTCATKSADSLIPPKLGSNSFRIGITAGGAECMGGGDLAQNLITVTPKTTDTCFVKVPLKAYAV